MAIKFNDRQIKALIRERVAAKYSVGGGLYLRVSEEGTAFWLLRYTIFGKRREMIIGRYPEWGLAKSTLEAAKLKLDVRAGIDPLAEKKRPGNVDIATVNDLAEDWLKNDIEKRLKHPGIPCRIYKKDLAPSLGELTLAHQSIGYPWCH
jgi:hypothetical protein